MSRKILSFVLCVACLLSVMVCAQAETEDFLPTISGTYVELFLEMSKAEYHEIWLEAVTPIVGAENAEAATEKLIKHCTAELYGAEAVEAYTADPESTRFDCYFIGGVAQFVMDGYTTKGLKL